MWYAIGIAAALAATFVLGLSYYCYRRTFYEPPRKKKPEGEIPLPEGEIYEPFHPTMEQWARETLQMPRQRFSIRSFDGLTLWSSYYEYAPGAPVEIMFHGYRGSVERDLAGGVQRCFRLGRSCLLVEQRCSGESEGRSITFGIREHRDCIAWAEFMADRFGPDVKLILTGLSMGAATVLTAAGKPLPDTVIGILADCSYSTPKEIIQKVIGEMGLPPKLSYPFVRLGARLYGGFDLEETSPMQAMESCTLPVLFFHGEADDYVPCDMSRRLFAACPSRKQLVTVPGAGHGLCYLMDDAGYMKAAREFFGPEGTYRGESLDDCLKI